MGTRRRTVAQALIEYLTQQRVQWDHQAQPFFGGCFGIFGHGNVAGIGQALQANPEFRYYQCRNEQGMVHTAAAYAKMHNRKKALVCTSSVGPGATNMITAAAGATINRLPVLLLPGDIFGRRNVGPVLQQLESEHSQDISVNDCFKPVSRYWDRIYRPEQLTESLPEAMRVLTSPSETGAVTLALPQDLQTEAWDFPGDFFEARTWVIGRTRADLGLLDRAASWIRESARPLIVAGGGVHYAEATEALAAFAEQTGIPVVETQAGKGALHYAHPQCMGGVGATGTLAANRLAQEADLVLGIGTRYTDFTTASRTAFQNDSVRFVNINVASFDAAKQHAIPLVADARVCIEELAERLQQYSVSTDYRQESAALARAWDSEVDRLYATRHAPLLSQVEIIGALNEFSRDRDVVVCAAGSLPGDLHKLWRTRDPKGYHLEYGYSCMGYEIAGGLGVKMADPDREVYVMVGDASYLMLNTEIVTALQEGYKLTILLLDNHGYSSIGGLSESLGSEGFGTHYRHRGEDGQLSGEVVAVDFAANAASLGAHAITVRSHEELLAALEEARETDRTTLIAIETDREHRVGGFESWWDVPVAEVSEDPRVQEARKQYEDTRNARN